MGNYSDLSNEEKAIATFISLGYSTKEIAKVSGKPVGVVEYQIDKIKRKLGCTKNTQVAFIVSKSTQV